LVSNFFTFFSGGRDSHCFLCASALLHKIWTLLSGERDCHCFWCATELMTKTCAFSLGERDSCYRFTAAEFVFIFCLKKHSTCFLIWVGVWVLRTLAICMQLLPYFLYSCINILCLYSVHLPLFILLIGNLVGTSFPDPKEAGRHKKQIKMRSNCYAQRPMECLTGEEWVIKNR
jgi:hypothetical protein